MQREEALEKIAWWRLKQISREEAEAEVKQFFKEQLKPRLRNKIDQKLVELWENQEPPDRISPGDPLYRPVLIDRMVSDLWGATNEYILNYLRSELKLKVDKIEGEVPYLIACPVCNYRTFEVRGTWDTCPVCGWTSDPVQEAIHADPTGANGISLNDARENFQEIGAISLATVNQLDPDDKKKYPIADD